MLDLGLPVLGVLFLQIFHFDGDLASGVLGDKQVDLGRAEYRWRVGEHRSVLDEYLRQRSLQPESAYVERWMEVSIHVRDLGPDGSLQVDVSLLPNLARHHRVSVSVDGCYAGPAQLVIAGYANDCFPDGRKVS